ncbi:MAG TPA: hypothetical protein EYG11_01200 [Candidatus Latescibacteria bacterium]|nr:hypothetical protein [Candidatus Handelsmanbacteria bacterium]HIL07290.1 hypothetical protein [Candidatus Latescibacterota bacterium]
MLRRKESFDAVFTQYGRSLKPGLLLAQWNHKYDFRPLDEQLLERADNYEVLILPEIERLSAEEAERLEAFVRRGGLLVFTGNTGRLNADGASHGQPLFQAWRTAPRAGSVGGLAAGGAGGPSILPADPGNRKRSMLWSCTGLTTCRMKRPPSKYRSPLAPCWSHAKYRMGCKWSE